MRVLLLAVLAAVLALDWLALSGAPGSAGALVAAQFRFFSPTPIPQPPTRGKKGDDDDNEEPAPTAAPTSSTPAPAPTATDAPPDTTNSTTTAEPSTSSSSSSTETASETSTSTSTATASPTSTPPRDQGALDFKTSTILISVAAVTVVGAALGIWAFRKWKLRPSKDFKNRIMQPSDWSPSNRRTPSTDRMFLRELNDQPAYYP